MKILFETVFVMISGFRVFGQKSVADLKPAHTSALEQFLSENKDYGFMSENILGKEYLKEISKWFKKPVKPYYAVADFNGDKVSDFAVILSRKGKSKDLGKAFPKEHRFERKLAVIIFNGDKKGGFAKAFVENIDAPSACFINFEDKQLYFSVFESDADTIIFKPVGKTYAAKRPKT